MPSLPEIHTLRDLRRSQIVAAARAIVAERGLEALTFAELEARLAFTRGVITYHFKDKDEIVLAVLESAVSDFDAGALAEVRARDTLPDKVRAAIEGRVRGLLERPEAMLILVSFWARVRSDPSIAEPNARLFRQWRAQAATLVRLAQAEGVATGLDPATGAALLVGQVVGIVTQVLFDPTALSIDALIDEATATTLARWVG